jgi:hypothetical protein
MGSGLKKKINYKGLSTTNWIPTEDYNKWNSYCIENDIRIFAVPTQQGPRPEEWRIGICLGPYKRGEKPYFSPNVYSVDTIYEEMSSMKKYYYDKRKKND